MAEAPVVEVVVKWSEETQAMIENAVREHLQARIGDTPADVLQAKLEVVTRERDEARKALSDTESHLKHVQETCRTFYDQREMVRAKLKVATIDRDRYSREVGAVDLRRTVALTDLAIAQDSLAKMRAERDESIKERDEARAAVENMVRERLEAKVLAELERRREEGDALSARLDDARRKETIRLEAELSKVRDERDAMWRQISRLKAELDKMRRERDAARAALEQSGEITSTWYMRHDGRD